jgi:hypothetical protein
MLDTRGLVIGELAIREKLLTREQLEDVIGLQQKAGFAQPIGSLMLERKFLTRDQLDGLLRRQKQAIAEYEKNLSVSGLFGRMAIEMGFISERDLAAAIRRQLALDYEGRHAKIGQILIGMKALTPMQFWEIIHAQGLFRCGSCGHILDSPRLQGNSLYCEKCNKPALSLEES